jgi:hypothetical protein
MGELEMELALLREENARLKVEQHRPPDTGRIIEHMRRLEQSSDLERVQEAGARDGTAQTVAECMSMRDGLAEACGEVQQAMQSIRARLGALAVDSELAIAEHAGPPALSAPTAAEEHDLELAVGTPASTDLSQRAVLGLSHAGSSSES